MNKKADEKFLARALSQNVKFTTEKLLEPALDEYPPPFWASEEMPKRSVNFILLLHWGGCRKKISCLCQIFQLYALTLTRPIGLPPHAPVAQKIAD